MAALDDTEYIKQTVDQCQIGMKKLEVAFREMDIESIPSAANFLTVAFNSEEQAEMFNENMLRNGIILRHLKGWGLPDCIRITIGSEEEIKYFLEQLASIVQAI